MPIPATTTATPVHQRFRFVVSVQRLTFAKFRSCSELSAEVEKITVRHGGSPLPFKMPGDVTTTDVTLEYGVTDDGSLFAWFAQVASVGGGAIGGSSQPFRRMVSIAQRDHDDVTVSRWALVNAFPVKFVAGEWDNESNDFTIGAVTLTYDYFSQSLLKNAPDQAELSVLAARL